MDKINMRKKAEFMSSHISLARAFMREILEDEKKEANNGATDKEEEPTIQRQG